MCYVLISSIDLSSTKLTNEPWYSIEFIFLGQFNGMYHSVSPISHTLSGLVFTMYDTAINPNRNIAIDLAAMYGSYVKCDSIMLENTNQKFSQSFKIYI